MAATAAGEGPSGFSFEASLMMSFAARPCSRATSSIGRPGWYTGIESRLGLSWNGRDILKRVENFFYVHMRGDHVADEADFFDVARPRFHDEIVHGRSDCIAAA